MSVRRDVRAAIKSAALVAIGIILATVVGPGGPAAASCGIEPGEEFYTSRHEQRDPITAAFFGTVTDASGPRWDAVFTVEVGSRVAGSVPAKRSIAFSSYVNCGDIRLNVGQRYLFAIAPGSLDGAGSLVFETDGPAWRWVVGGVTLAPSLDGRRVPTDPGALLDVLRRRIDALPPTSTVTTTSSVQPSGTLLALAGGLMGGLVMLRRRRRTA